MTLFEYTCTEGFKEILNFMWEPSETMNEDFDEVAFQRLGYREQGLKLYSRDFAYWLKVYKNMKNNEYEYLISINNHLYGQYVACRTFAEYIGFMKEYLPVIRSINEISIQTDQTFAL